MPVVGRRDEHGGLHSPTRDAPVRAAWEYVIQPMRPPPRGHTMEPFPVTSR